MHWPIPQWPSFSEDYVLPTVWHLKERCCTYNANWTRVRIQSIVGIISFWTSTYKTLQRFLQYPTPFYSVMSPKTEMKCDLRHINVCGNNNQFVIWAQYSMPWRNVASHWENIDYGFKRAREIQQLFKPFIPCHDDTVTIGPYYHLPSTRHKANILTNEDFEHMSLWNCIWQVVCMILEGV